MPHSEDHQGTGMQEPCRKPGCLWAVWPGPGPQSTVSPVSTRGPSGGAGAAGRSPAGTAGTVLAALAQLGPRARGPGPSAHLKAPHTWQGIGVAPAVWTRTGWVPTVGASAQQECGLARGVSPAVRRPGIRSSPCRARVPTHAANSCHVVCSTVTSFPSFLDDPGTASL